MQKRLLLLAPVLFSLSAFIGIAGAADPTTQAVDRPTTQPAPGISYHEEVRAKPPLHLHICIVDLTNPSVHIKVSRGGVDPALAAPWETTLMPVSKMAERDGLVAAVNGNFFASKDVMNVLGRKVPYFAGNWARCCGFAMSDGKLFSETPLTMDWPSMVVDVNGKIRFGQFRSIPADARQVVSGSGLLIANGRDLFPLAPGSSADATPYPRTAVGINQDGKRLILLVVDGRRPDYSVGVSIRDLAEEMLHLGAWEALNLDSGGSSTMVIRDAAGHAQVVNRPSDGHDFPIDLSIERNIADALGVTVDAATQPAVH